MAIDIRWFQNRIADLGLSQRRISTIIANNPNTLSLILNGKRDVSHEEIGPLAQILDATLEEVVKHLGATVPANRAGSVKVLGVVDETGRVTEKRALGSVDAPARADAARLRAVIFETADGRLPHVHGWTLYFAQPAKPRGVDADSLDRLCLVEIGDKEGHYLGVVRRSLERGRYDIVNGFTGKQIVGGVAVRSAAPVAWIKA